MTDHAIVIGIDAYSRAEWQLTAAVRDAIAFARWVTKSGEGRASLETLTLLLSRKPGARAIDLPYERANRDAIHAVLNRYARKKAGKSADRLWVFYAGHAVAPPGGSADNAPVIVPEDAVDIDDYLFDAPLALSKYLGPLQLQPPKIQLFFVDACRGIVEPDDSFTTSVQLHFDLSKLVNDTPFATQAVLHATTAGQVASEVGLHGLFGRALIAGLEGRGPKLIGDVATGGNVLTFGSLASFVQRQVRALGEDARKSGMQLPTQVPSPSTFNLFDAQAPLVHFAGPIPKAKLKVLVEPAQAANVGQAWVLKRDDHTGQFQPNNVQGPPAPVVTWSLPFAQHKVEVRADGFRAWSRVVDLIEDKTIPARLEYESEVLGFESVSGTLPETVPKTRGETTGHLVVQSSDRMARIELFDDIGERIDAGWGSLKHNDLPEGPYRALITHPGQAPEDRFVFVKSASRQYINVDPEISVTPRLSQALDFVQIHVDGGLSYPSEVFGPATTNIGSLLSWAAWAARFPDQSSGHRLRTLGVAPLKNADLTKSFVQVLIGDATGELLDTLEIAFGRLSQEERVEPSTIPALNSLALQWSDEVPLNGGSVVISADTLRALSLPVPNIPGYVSIIVLARTADGRIEIHRYLHPLELRNQTEFSDIIRRQEDSWRALEARLSFLPGEAEQLLRDEHLDPLAIAIVGYRLAREGRLELLDVPGPNGITPFQRLKSDAASLPDTHILRARMVEPTNDKALEDLQQLMETAASAGLPVVVDGYEALTEWTTHLAAQQSYPPPIPKRPLISHAAWTTLDMRKEAPIATPQAIPARTLETWSAPTWADNVLPVADATARIEAPGDVLSYTGTGFLVANRVIATSEHCVGTPSLQIPPDGGELASGWTASFGPWTQVRLQGIRTRSQRGPIIGDPWGVLRVTLVSLDEDVAAPVKIGWHLPKVGRRIAIIGHPSTDARVPPDAVAAAFASLPTGEKVITPGTIVNVSAKAFKYEAFTMNGSSGGPVVDIETGKVIGLHFAGTYERGTKFGFAVPMALLRSESMWGSVGVQTPEPSPGGQQKLE